MTYFNADEWEPDPREGSVGFRNFLCTGFSEETKVSCFSGLEHAYMIRPVGGDTTADATCQEHADPALWQACEDAYEEFHAAPTP